MNTWNRNLSETTQTGIKKSWEDRDFYNPDITVVAALFDGRQTGIPHTVGVYTSEWVDKLYRGIERHYDGKFNFICLTDKNYKFKEPIESVRFKRSVDQYGWMSLMELYRPDLCMGKRFTIGLDTIITGSLNDIFDYDAKIALCQDPIFPKTVCNAVTISNHDFCEEFWSLWTGDEYNILHTNKLSYASSSPAASEMVLLRNCYGDSPRLDTIFKGKILSYKAHIKDHWERLADTSIVYFHGSPKPHELMEQRWIGENWR